MFNFDYMHNRYLFWATSCVITRVVVRKQVSLAFGLLVSLVGNDCLHAVVEFSHCVRRMRYFIAACLLKYEEQLNYQIMIQLHCRDFNFPISQWFKLHGLVRFTFPPNERTMGASLESLVSAVGVQVWILTMAKQNRGYGFINFRKDA